MCLPRTPLETSSPAPARGRAGRLAGAAAAVALAFAVLHAPAALAADTGTKAAKEHYEKAEVAYKLGRFADALAEYSRAYEAKALPAFLFNIAQCHKLLGDYEHAIFFYESFLRDAPETPNRALVESLLSESRDALASTKRTAAERAAAEHKEAEARAAAASADAERFRAERLAAEKIAAEAALRGSGPSGAHPSGPTPLVRRWWFLTAVGVIVVGGAAALGVALAFPRTITVLPSGSLGTLDRRE